MLAVLRLDSDRLESSRGASVVPPVGARRRRRLGIDPRRERIAESTAAFDDAEISCDAERTPATERRAPNGPPPEAPRFARLVDDHGSALLGLLRRLVGDWHTAQDLRQETLIRALTTMRRSGGPAFVRPWLFRIALRATADFWRDRANWRSGRALGGPDIAVEPETEASACGLAMAREERESAKRRIEGALARLPPRTRSVVEMRYVHGLSVREIAELYRMTCVGVRVRLHRGRESVRRSLSGIDSAR